MAESISRVLRDGALEGEYAPALTIEDSISSPFGFDVFTHLLAQLSSNILAGKSQPRGVVVVSFSRSPSFYVDLLKRRGSDTALSQKWIRILDFYTDPLGWTDQIVDSANTRDISKEASSVVACLCKDMQDMDKLYSSIIEQGTGLSKPGKERFSVAIDSVDELLRHASTSSVAGLLNNLRSHDQVSSVFWLLHSDIHEDKVTSILEYMSSMVASIEPLNQSANWKRGNLESFSLLKQNFGKGRLNVRFKRRNGRVRALCEEFHIEQERISFTSVSSGDGVVNQSLVPKVQFNLQLSEKERIERENVVLPFEHQGNGKTIEIYDGRRSLTENLKEVAPTLNEKLQTSNNTGVGEIIYFRDSDDEMPDSDEDPDDDLDI